MLVLGWAAYHLKGTRTARQRLFCAGLGWVVYGLTVLEQMSQHNVGACV